MWLRKKNSENHCSQIQKQPFLALKDNGVLVVNCSHKKVNVKMDDWQSKKVVQVCPREHTMNKREDAIPASASEGSLNVNTDGFSSLWIWSQAVQVKKSHSSDKTILF